MRTRWFVLIALLVVAAGTFVVMQPKVFALVWPHLLTVKAPLEKADCLILLGGEEEARPTVTARLYVEGVAPVIFITGEGDAMTNRKTLLEHGVPLEAIRIEPSSRSTLMNARLLRPMLEKERVRTAVIVTSPFHMRRALAVFQHEIPSIRFGIVPAKRVYWETPQGIKGYNQSVLMEFVKTAYYWCIHGIAPFPKTKG